MQTIWLPVIWIEYMLSGKITVVPAAMIPVGGFFPKTWWFARATVIKRDNYHIYITFGKDSAGLSIVDLRKFFREATPKPTHVWARILSTDSDALKVEQTSLSVFEDLVQIGFPHGTFEFSELVKDERLTASWVPKRKKRKADV